MARELFDRGFSSTIPDDLADPPRFGQVIETTKDCLVLELRKFIDSARTSATRRAEIPTIEKYATNSTGDPYETVARVQRKHADIKEAMPHIAVLATSTNELKLSVGTPYLDTVQEPPRLLALSQEPYTLSEDDVLVLRTAPKGVEVLSYITFKANRFPDAHPIGAALAADVARVINEQAQYVRASDVGGYLQIACGGSQGATGPNEIEVLYEGSSAGAYTALDIARTGTATEIQVSSGEGILLASAGTFTDADVGLYLTVVDAATPFRNEGRFLISAVAEDGASITYSNSYAKATVSTVQWFISQRDDSTNVLRPPAHRYASAADVQVQIDILADDENERDELTDLIYSFFTFFAEQKFFTFWGRSFFDSSVSREWYQVILKSSARAGGENEVPRSGDPTDKIHISSIGIDVTTVLYLDREVYKPGTTTPWITTEDDFVFDDSLVPVT